VAASAAAALGRVPPVARVDQVGARLMEGAEA
jgi:hypothetical protein